MDAGAAGQRHLGREMGGAPEPVDAEPAPLGEVGPQQGPVADDPGTEQRRGLQIVEFRRQRVGVGLVDDGVLRVAPVDVPAGEARVGAEVLATGHAEAADAAGVGQPGHPDPVAHPPPGAAGPQPVDHADDLVARRHPGTARCEVALGQVEVRPAHAARPDAHPDLAWAGLGDGPLDAHQRVAMDRAGPVDHPCLHHGGHRLAA